jgi:hypothetical protein
VRKETDPVYPARYESVKEIPGGIVTVRCPRKLPPLMRQGRRPVGAG